MINGYYVADDEGLISIADAIRRKTGRSEKLSYYYGYVTAIDNYTNDATASANDIMYGQTAYISGSKVTGTFVPREGRVTFDSDGTLHILSSGNILGEVSSTFTSNGNYTPSSGYAFSEVTVNVTYDTELIERRISGNYVNSSIKTVGSCAFAYCSTISSVDLSLCTSIMNSAFRECINLLEINASNCSYIGPEAFYGCYEMKSAFFPNCTSLMESAFWGCYSLSSVSLPKCTYIGTYCFNHCSLNIVDLPVCSFIGNRAFQDCSKLFRINLHASSVCTLGGIYAFSYVSSIFQIFVPTSLVSEYKVAQNWSQYSSVIYGM